MSKLYQKIECPICNKVISVCGLGKVSHMRSHVRKGQVVEVGGQATARANRLNRALVVIEKDNLLYQSPNQRKKDLYAQMELCEYI